MIQIIIRMASITHVPHLFSVKHIFLERNTASLSIQKTERKKIQLPYLYRKQKGRKNLNSNNNLGDTKFS